ncbi:cellulose biosynthesis cyclic di-GMP-binding regulatory protein BcsB [Leptolyngbya sp. FACHB-261]|uniref:cellulose biosynthesis cyclic di-GMP-binding regulatory protein BcsB n=1 Tax=Leptolyngbya sp. FACHB-261 TaxID=2692806 RepID=UPI00168862D4|nr:cellulose biosynthesis cyclic di-GMP-binding regulatory protein BcsB [Leptolyngbya sp. FACHB-261]MBD2104314.1 cellulose biosynthesis cyclic di-GMP-binding regulatory protein BcsB [Leptolyngbya sp. FACHB-261]
MNTRPSTGRTLLVSSLMLSGLLVSCSPSKPPAAPETASPASSAPGTPATSSVSAAPLEIPPIPIARVASNSESVTTNIQPGGAAVTTLQSGSYVLKFDPKAEDKPIGNQLTKGIRLKGTYAESNLFFPRPRDWSITQAKALIRFQHSPALLPDHSTLTIRLNGSNLDTVKLDAKSAKAGELEVPIPIALLQDNNNLTLVVQQHYTLDCEDPFDESLWTEILPTSQVSFNYDPKPIQLDFNRFPRPFLDDLSLLPANLTYLLPPDASSEDQKQTKGWLSALARFQTALGRTAEYRPLKTTVVESLRDAKGPIVIVGTPQNQPELANLELPFKLQEGKFLDGKGKVVPDDVGVLALTATTGPVRLPVLVISGNGAAGVEKAAQFLVQGKDADIGTGRGILINRLTEVPKPNPRDWPRYLPPAQQFDLKDLNVKDTTVRGAFAGFIEFDFRSLPDDVFLPNESTITLNYSYGAQVDSNLSTVEVLIDNIAVGSFPLEKSQGETNLSRTFKFPATSTIRPDSRMQVVFRLFPKQLDACRRTAQDQLWATLHPGTRFDLPRESSARLPDLQLLRYGYPFGGPQDLSEAAVVVPDRPSPMEVRTMLAMVDRLGRLSQADAVNLGVYTASSLPGSVRNNANLIAIGSPKRFPLPEVMKLRTGMGFLPDFLRFRRDTEIQAVPDQQGVLTQVISPWNSARVVLGLTGQTDAELQKVVDLLERDSLFFQLEGDTALIASREDLKFLSERPQRLIGATTPRRKFTNFFQNNWLILPFGLILTSLLVYYLLQRYIDRLEQDASGQPKQEGKNEGKGQK